MRVDDWLSFDVFDQVGCSGRCEIQIKESEPIEVTR
jgi:hypothetical protein